MWTGENAALSCGRAKTETFENGVEPSLQGRAFQDGEQTLDNCHFYFTVDFKLIGLFAIAFSGLKSSKTICSTNAQYHKAAGFYEFEHKN